MPAMNLSNKTRAAGNGGLVRALSHPAAPTSSSGRAISPVVQSGQKCSRRSRNAKSHNRLEAPTGRFRAKPKAGWGRFLRMAAAAFLIALSGGVAVGNPPGFGAPEQKRVLAALGVNSDGPRRFYQADGSYVGRMQVNGRTLWFYDAQGRNAGRATVANRTVTFHDAAGRLEGRGQTVGNTIQFYDARGRSTGRAVTTASRVTLYDASGRLAGRVHSSATGTASVHDARGHVVGRITQ